MLYQLSYTRVTTFYPGGEAAQTEACARLARRDGTALGMPVGEESQRASWRNRGCVEP